VERMVTGHDAQRLLTQAAGLSLQPSAYAA